MTTAAKARKTKRRRGLFAGGQVERSPGILSAEKLERKANQLRYAAFGGDNAELTGGELKVTEASFPSNLGMIGLM